MVLYVWGIRNPENAKVHFFSEKSLVNKIGKGGASEKRDIMNLHKPQEI